jgi:hypothetical protein
MSIEKTDQYGLTRRPTNAQQGQSWQVYCGDVRVGHIGRRSGVPNHADLWGWSCGFYPGLNPGQHRSGTATTFEAARSGFEAAWGDLAPAARSWTAKFRAR